MDILDSRGADTNGAEDCRHNSCPWLGCMTAPHIVEILLEKAARMRDAKPSSSSSVLMASWAAYTTWG